MDDNLMTLATNRPLVSHLVLLVHTISGVVEVRGYPNPNGEQDEALLRGLALTLYSMRAQIVCFPSFLPRCLGLPLSGGTLARPGLPTTDIVVCDDMG